MWWKRSLAFSALLAGAMAAAILVAGLATWFALPVTEDQDQPRQASETQAQDVERESPLAFLRRWAQEPADPKWDKPQCHAPRSHNEADLCQQRSMAKSARSAFVIADKQFFAGIAGISFLVLTLILTWRSAEAARVAAEAAVEQAKIARNAERPFINIRMESVDEGHITTVAEGPYHILTATLHPSNDGRSIALLESSSIWFAVCDLQTLPVPDLVEAEESALGSACLAPGDDAMRIRAVIRRVPEEAWREANKRNRRMILGGYVRYRDLHDIVRRRGFAFDYRPGDDEAAVPVPIREGGLSYDREETKGQNAKRRPRERWPDHRSGPAP